MPPSNSFGKKGSQSEWKLVDSFDSTYWSGQDVKVFANDIFIDEAIQINYQIMEQARPYYGYASYYPNRIHHGSRIITGELSYNFKKNGVIFSLLNLLKSQTSVSSVIDGRPPEAYITPQWGGNPAQKIKSGQLSTSQLSDFIASQKAGTSFDSPATQGPPLPQNNSLTNNRPLFQTTIEGFDLSIVFGGNINSAKVLKLLDGDVSLQPHNSYAEGATIQAQEEILQTGIVLSGVSIIGLAKSIADDGRPIIETVTFQARNIDLLSNTKLGNSVSSAQSQINQFGNLPQISQGLNVDNSGNVSYKW
jgi:hypothetical protein